MTRTGLMQGIVYLLTNWPNRARTPEAVQTLADLYWDALHDLTDAQFLARCRTVVRTRTSEFFPPAAELRPDPETDNDPIARWHLQQNGPGALTTPTLLPEVALSREQEAVRQARLAEIRIRTKEMLKQAQSNQPRRADRRARSSHQANAEADMWLRRMRGEGEAR